MHGFRRISPLFVFVLFIAVSTLAGETPQLRIKAGSRVEVTSSQKYVSGQVLVRFRSNVSATARAASHRAVSATVTKQFKHTPALELVQLTKNTEVHEAVRRYRADPNVLYAEPNFVVQALGDINDPIYPQQWHLSNTAQLGGGISGADIHVPQAWQITTGSKAVVVMTLDSGIDYTHPDLAANVYRNVGDCNNNGLDDDGNGYVDDCYGINTVSHTSDPMDDNGHGTHVAGLIGAAGNNGIGVAGVNWDVQILACKFLDQSGFGSVAGAVECLNYAKTLKQRGVNIVATSNSWGGVQFSQALADAMDEQRQAGILFITAAGNDFSDNDRNPIYPANTSLPNVISVAATTNSDRFALFSNTGKHTVHIGAPGQEILSTYSGAEYAYMSGTSMATPLVTGVAALLAAQNPSLAWKEIKNLILAGGDSLPELQSTVTGRRLNAYGAMTCADSPVLRRLKPVQSDIAGAVGSPIVISYLNINCRQPGSALEAKVSTGETIALTDDATGADLDANDGVFTGSWTPTQAGTFSIALPDGDSLSVEILTDYRAIQETGSYRQIGGTSLNLSDDSVASFTSPFPIQYGGSGFNQVYVSSDGTISFTDSFQSFYNRALPLLADNQLSRIWDSTAVTLLAPFWDDLYPIPNTDQNVFWDVTGSAPNRELVIEWRNVRLFDCRTDGNKTVTFQVVFHESDSSVLYQYKNVQSGCSLWYDQHDFGGSAVVGLQISPTVGTTWLQVASVLANNTTLRWQLVTDPISSNPVPTISTVTPDVAPTGGANTDVSITGTNFVPGSLAYWDTNQQYFSYRLLTSYISPTQLKATIPSGLTGGAFTGRHQISVINPAPGGGESNALPFGVGMNPAYITSLSPSSATAGGPAFTLTINGSGLGDGSSGQWIGASWNGILLTTRRISATQLQADVPAALIAQPGTASVDVYVIAWGTTNTLSFSITSATGSSTSLVNIQNGVPTQSSNPKPYRFLGWGYAKQAGSEYMKRFSRPFASPSVALTSSNGVQAAQSGLPTRPFGSPLPGIGMRPTLPTGFLPSSVAMADFNGDGKMDWAISNAGDNSIWIYLGHGDGSWDLPHIIRLRGFTPVAIIATDLRGNGIRDLVVAEADSATLGLLKGRGDGTFEDEDEYFLPAPPTFLCAGDFNNDGHQDVLAGTLGSVEQGALYLMQGDGAGRLGVPVSLPNHKRYPETTPTAAWLAFGDWDKDGFLDVTASEPFADGTSEAGVLSYLNRKDGSFKEAQEVLDNYWAPVYGVAAGDINEDGCLDLVAVQAGSSALRFLGNCDGTFTFGAETSIGLGDFSYGLKLADVDGDGHLDLIASGVVSGGGGVAYGNDSGALITVARGKGNGSFEQPKVYRGEASAFMFDVGDVNGDGKPDIITANQDSDSASLFLNKGNGDFGPPAGAYVGYLTGGVGTGGTSNSPMSEPVAADITGHGRLDVGYLELERYGGQPYNVVTLPNLGGGKFGAPVRTPLFPGNAYFYDLLFADFRNTGHADLLYLQSDVNGGNESYVFAPANSDGTFGTPVGVSTTTSWGALGSGDFNRDGKLDFVIADVTASGLRLSVFLGNNDGTFNPLTPTVLSGSLTTRPYAVYVADVNKDGKLDVLVWLSNNAVPNTGKNVYEFLGYGNGNFASGKMVLQNVDAFRLADLNHDGLQDVVEFTDFMSAYPALAAPRVRVFMGQADGSFVLQHTYTPYTGIPITVEQARVIVVPPASSRLADFDGDGEPDIAMYQFPITGSRHAYVQFLKGNGDGSFTPTYAMQRLETGFVPYLAADFDGDGKADLFDLVAFSSSWNMIPGKRGAELQLSLLSDPVAGQQGTVRITVNAPADQSVTLNLKSSEPTVSLPANITVPAGTNIVDVPFQLTSTFDNSHVFSITAASFDQSYSVYGTQFPRGVAGFALSATSGTSRFILSGGTAKYPVAVVSKAGWTGTVTARCEGLPVGASCAIADSVTVGAGSCASYDAQVNTTSAIAQGKYTFSYIVSDGTNEVRADFQLTVGDFSVVVSPKVIGALANTWQVVNVNVPSTQGYSDLVMLSCTGLPSTITCSSALATAGDSTQLVISVGTASAADYPFTVVGTSEGVTRSASATLHLMDLTTTLNTTTATLKVGDSMTSTLTLSAPNGFNEGVTVSCSVPNQLSCTLAPSSVTFASVPDSKTVQITIKATSISASLRNPVSGKSNRTDHSRYLAFSTLVAFGLLISRKRTAKLLITPVLLIGLCGPMVSCGGGGGSSTSTPPPTQPPPQTQTASAVLYIQSTSMRSREAGVITVTIKQ